MAYRATPQYVWSQGEFFTGASGWIEAAAEAGLRIPRDLSVLVDRETRLPARGLVFGGALYGRYKAGRTAAQYMAP